jgi:hypothetical protein
MIVAGINDEKLVLIINTYRTNLMFLESRIFARRRPVRRAGYRPPVCTVLM